MSMSENQPPRYMGSEDPTRRISDRQWCLEMGRITLADVYSLVSAVKFSAIPDNTKALKAVVDRHKFALAIERDEEPLAFHHKELARSGAKELYYIDFFMERFPKLCAVEGPNYPPNSTSEQKKVIDCAFAQSLEEQFPEYAIQPPVNTRFAEANPELLEETKEPNPSATSKKSQRRL